jgi:hypothetical protein
MVVGVVLVVSCFSSVAGIQSDYIANEGQLV